MRKWCQTCGQEYQRPPDYSRTQWEARRFCSLACVRHPDRELGPKTRYRKTGPNGQATHRAVMERVLGRKLRSDEYVHHQDEDKLVNEPENLEVTDPVMHGRHHHLKHPISKLCAICGTVFTPHKTKRARQQTCSPPCKCALLSRRHAERRAS